MYAVMAGGQDSSEICTFGDYGNLAVIVEATGFYPKSRGIAIA
jgi:hypothetical protein